MGRCVYKKEHTSSHTCHLLSKMPKQLSKEAKLEKRRTQRRNNIAIAKEEQYIVEYIRYKYPTIYKEAAGVCLQLKAKYPDKIDWRKTAEHRAWLVNGATTEHPIFYTNAILATNLFELRKAMNRASIHLVNPTTRPQTATTLNARLPEPQIPVPQPSPEPQIPVPQPSPEPQIPVPQPSPEPQIPVPQPSPEPQIPVPQPSPEPQIPVPQPSPEPQIPVPQPSPEPQIPVPQPSPEPQIPVPQPSPEPQIPVPQPSPEPQIPVPQPSPEPQIPVPQPSPEPQIPVPQPSPEPQIHKSINTQHYSDNMQLVIPLIKPPVKQPGLITETLEITTEEVIGEDGQSVKFDEIDPKIIESVIEELRKDPDLKDVFANVEQEFEIDTNMDIDIELDTRLEDELNWEFW